MPFSQVVNGKVLDVTSRRMSNGGYAVSLGSENIGQAFKLRFGWSAVPAKPTPLGVIEGFSSRWQVYKYLLKVREIEFQAPH